MFGTPTDSLTIESLAEVEVTVPTWPVYNLTAGGASYPFRYPAGERTDLGSLTPPSYVDRSGRLRKERK
jgi:hypothetical protein